MSANPDNLKPQPPPVRGAANPTWRRVVSDCTNLARNAGVEGECTAASVWRLLAEDGKARDAFGAEKYGTRHQHDNGRDHARDAYQEALDGMMYAYAVSLPTCLHHHDDRAHVPLPQHGGRKP